jgi:GNAT superfamily N-acetyltransferase
MRGVAPDQSEITEEAANVWAYYYNLRGPGRVAEQRVVTSSTLPRDFREEDEDEDRDDIYESRFRSSLNSVYTKPSVTVLPQLERMGVLERLEGGMNLRGSSNARDAFGPRKPLGVHGLTYRAKQNSNGDTLIAVYEGSKRIAHLDAYWQYSMRSIEEKEEEVTRLKRGVACATDLRTLGAEGKYPNVIAIHHAFITEDKWKGKGVGRAMYEALLSEAFAVRESRVGGSPGPMFAVPMSCLSVGSTSSDAMRVWASHARRYPSSGTTIRVDAPPVLGTPNRSR